MRAAFLYGRWHFLRFPSESLVQNDRGYVGTGDNETGATGCLFPLRHDLAVTVLSSVESYEVAFVDGTYYVAVESNVFDTSAAEELRESVAEWADSEIYGPSKEVVKAAAVGFRRERQDGGPELLFSHSSEWLSDHELDFFDFLTQIETPPAQ